MQLLVKVDLLVLQVLELFGVGSSGIDFFSLRGCPRAAQIMQRVQVWSLLDRGRGGQSGETQGREMLGMLEMVKWRARCS